MAILKYLPLIILPLTMTGCYEDFDPKIDTKPVLCINSNITAGEPIKVNLSRSWVYADNQDVFLRPGEATAKIYVNGQLMPEDYIAAEGDEIHIVAESEKYGNAEASVKVPVAVPFSEVKISTDTKYSLRDVNQPMTFLTGFDLRVIAQIQDDPATDNYFQIGYTAACPTGLGEDADWDTESYAHLSLGSFDDSFEPIFIEHIGVFESVMADGYTNMMTFSDRQFAGKNYNLNMILKNMGYYVLAPEYNPELFDCTVTFYLVTISRSYYDRILYLWQRDSGVLGDYGDLGLADPIWGYSNVSTGAGVVAARSYSSFTVSLRDLLETNFRDNYQPFESEFFTVGKIAGVTEPGNDI